MASSSLSLSVVTQDPTLATPTNPFKRDKPVLKDTACGQQTRFYSNGPNGVITLKRWRTALYHRYVNLLQARGGYTVVWRDTDARNEHVECGDLYLDCSNPDIPDDLGKTFIQVRGGAKPQITITLYFHLRRKTGGTCLIQGHNKDTWVLSEYDSLCTFVQQLKDGCADPADNVPVDVPRDQSCDPTISPIVSIPDTPPRPTLDSSLPLIGLEADDSTSLSPIVQSCDPRDDSAKPVPELLTGTTVSGVSDMTSDGPITTPSIPHPSSSGPHLRDDPHSTLSDHSDVPAGQSLATTHSTPEPAPFTPSPVSHIVTQVATKGDVTTGDLTSPGLPVSCTQVDSDYSELVVSGVCDEKPLIIRELQTQLCNTQAAVKALNQELCQLKTVTVIKINQLDSKVCESAVKMANDLRMSESCMCGKMSHLQNQLTNLAEFHCLVDDTLQRLISEQRLPVTSGHTSQLLVSTKPDGSAPVNGDAITSVKPVSTTAGDVIPVRITVPKNIPPSGQKDKTPGNAVITVNVASPTADSHREGSGPSQPGQRQGGGNRITGSQQQRNDLLPSERVFDHSVEADTTTLVIGDSVVRNFKGEKMTMYQGERVQVISVSGLQTSHLSDWLKKQPQSPGVQLVTFHVGVNDCKSHEITSQQWESHFLQGRVPQSKRPGLIYLACCPGEKLSP